MNKIIEQQVTCIICPRGCRLTVSGRIEVPEEKNDTVRDSNEIARITKDLSVQGNLCPRGVEYGKKEVTFPTRKVTSTVRINHSVFTRLPVVTKEPVPKDKVFEVMAAINKTSVNCPVRMGDLILQNVAGTGIDVIASRNMTE